MLIWLGKQMLGQKDKVETEATNTHHVSGPMTAKLCILATGRKCLVSALWAGRLQI